MEKYKDILHLPHHRSPHRPSMPRRDRAAQFAPFSALAGHREGTEEEGRITQPRIFLGEDEMLRLEGRLGEIATQVAQRPEVVITYFVPDGRKDVGEYVRVLGRVKGVDLHRQMLVLEGRREIPLGDIIALDGGVLEE